MDFSFREPTLEVKRVQYRVVQGKDTVDTLETYLRDRNMQGLLREYIRRGYLTGEMPMEMESELGDAPEEELMAWAEKAAKEVEYEQFVRVTRWLFEKNTSLALKFDVYTAEIRMLILLERNSEISLLIKKIEGLIELGIDWGRRNKFKVYKGLVHLLSREYREASRQFSESLSTFEGEELLTYLELVRYTIFCGMISLSRLEIEKNLIDSSEICEVIKELPGAREMVHAFYECSYANLFSWLAVFSKSLYEDMHLQDRVDYFVYLVKVQAYAQLFMSYKAISLEQMSLIFGVSTEYIHRDIESMILRGDLLCKINHQKMMVYNTPAQPKDTVAIQAEEISHTIQKMISSE
ncbi:26S proteasome regulatory subunit N7 [Nematocida homosporus]|uniref:26S proteasome regulatory subunit N7 n=1 Tax=Nematocida homosporus TaxID=1912981 RepID=UPI00221E815B|nr:26S proteasome regulatory subunit N7 [Nematocida homosporus]KAI5185906.1 26S proteasome regulatory subunit N7 [Nematocida homosporus]